MIDWAEERRKISSRNPNRFEIASPVETLLTGSYTRINNPEQIEGLIRIVMDSREAPWNSPEFSHVYSEKKINLLDYGIELNESNSARNPFGASHNLRRIRLFKTMKGNLFRNEASNIDGGNIITDGREERVSDLRMLAYCSYMSSTDTGLPYFPDSVDEGLANYIIIKHLRWDGRAAENAATSVIPLLNTDEEDKWFYVVDSVEESLDTAIQKYEEGIKRIQPLFEFSGKEHLNRNQRLASNLLYNYECCLALFSDMLDYTKNDVETPDEVARIKDKLDHIRKKETHTGTFYALFDLDTGHEYREAS